MNRPPLHGLTHLAIPALVFLGAEILLLFFIPRTNAVPLIGTYALWFASAWMLIRRSRTFPDRFYLITGLAMVARLTAFFAWPSLSDDVYRYLWDGYLQTAGLHPLNHTPSEWMALGIAGTRPVFTELYPLLNSPDYYTVYPTLHQFAFRAASALFPGDIRGAVVVLKAWILLADLLVMYWMYRLSHRSDLKSNAYAWYALHPLVIAEFCGNLHFEVWMIAFLLMSVWMLYERRAAASAVCMAGAIITKLHPLLLLPAFVRRMKVRTARMFLLIATGISVIGLYVFLGFGPIPGDYATHFLTSVRLYVDRFEFNAGPYMLIRWIGTIWTGYNPIAFTGPFLLASGLLGILWVAWNRETGMPALLRSIALSYLVYYLTATTVHPWYVLTMLPFGLLTGFGTPLVWSAVVFVSYATYGTGAENFLLAGLEYTCIFASLIYEGVDGRRSLKIS